jgi:prepilin-type N-terminal cleavage/methylation domain-containing protein
MTSPLRKTQWSQGFTLIELLVVISIIAVLSSIILAAVSTTRLRAEYASVQESLIQMRNAYEIQYTNTGSYAGLMPSLIAAASTNGYPYYSCNIATIYNNCTIYNSTSNTIGCDDLYGIGSQADIICKNIINEDTSSASFSFGVINAVSPSDYAFAVYNPTNSSQSFCIRSNGTATVTSGATPCLNRTNW